MANPESISVGGVAILYGRFSDWTYPQFGSLVSVLSAGSSVDNEVLQSSAVPRLRATLSGWLQDPDDVAALNAYAASKAIVTVVDDALSRDAVIMDFSMDRVMPGLWSCSLALVDFGVAGS
jgi:hypothetical protein